MSEAQELDTSTAASEEAVCRNFPDQLKESVTAFNSGDYRRAAALISDLLAAGAEAERLRLALVQSLLRLFRLEECVRAAEKLAQLYPSNQYAKDLLSTLAVLFAEQRPYPNFALSTVAEYQAAGGEIQVHPVAAFSEQPEDPPPKVYQLKGALVLGYWWMVTSSDLILFKDLFTNPLFTDETYSTFKDLYYVEPQTVDPPAFLLAGRWAPNFYHFSLEYLPRVIMAEELGFDGVYIIPEDVGFAREYLEILGIPAERIVVHHGGILKATELYATEALDCTSMFRYPKVFLRLRERILAGLPPRLEASPAKRVYISRNRTNRIRKIINETALLELLQPYGFETLYAEQVPLREQILAVREAEVLLAPHGAGLIHALFSRPQGLCIEAFSPQFINPCVLNLAKLMGHRYYMLASYVNPVGSYMHGEDIAMPLEVLKLYLEQELSKCRSS